MIRLRPLAATLAAAALLAGCSNDSAGAPTAAATDAPAAGTSATSTATASAAPVDPASSALSASNPMTARDLPTPDLSELGKDFSEEGSAAFAIYYIKVLNYSRNASDSRVLRSLSMEECMGCQYDIDRVEEFTRLGYSHVGLETKFKSASFNFWDPEHQEVQLEVSVDRPPHTVTDRTGLMLETVPEVTNGIIYLWLKWVDNRWMIKESQ